LRKWISILALCVFTTSIWAGIALAQKDQNANGSFKGKHFNQSQDQRFKDVDQDWAREDIEKASKKGFVKGYEDGTFQPNKPVSSLETLVILVRAAGLEEQVEDYELSNQDLRSLKKIPYWAKAYVAVALEEGILLEEEIKTFNPNQGAKRYQVCIYMQKVLDKFNINPEDDDFMESFIDNHLFPLEAHKSIKNLARLGVVNGYPDGSFAPTRVVKRNEMARMINYLDKNCIQNSEAYVLNGTLSEADLKNQVLYLSVIDNKDKKWNFTVEEDDEILLYYGRQQLEFDDWDRIEAGGDVRVLLDKEQEAIWIKVAPPEEEADYLLFKGILEKVDLDDEELNLNIVDSKNKEWNFNIEEDEEIDVYYDGEKLEFDDWDRIEAGGDVRVLLDKEQEAIWIKIAPPEEEADYLLFKGILEKVDLDDEELNLNIVDSKNKEWNFSLEEDEIDVYYDGEKLEFDDWDRIEAGGDVRVLLDKEQEAIWIKITPPEQEKDYLVLTGTLSETIFNDEVVYLNIVDSENKEWNFTLEKADEMDISYDGQKLEFEELDSIEAGGAVKMLLDKDEIPLWIKISTPI
jgi:uncharacterized protein YdaT